MGLFGYTVFVSHGSADLEIATAIQDAARPLGVNVYTYEQDLQPGASLPKKLLDRIEAAHAVVVVLTRTGAESPTVNQEIGVARRAGKPIIPLVAADVDISRLALLQGIEHLPLNTENPSETLVALAGRLSRLRTSAERTIWLILIAAIGIWAASKS
jgi:hypothetical protein